MHMRPYSGHTSNEQNVVETHHGSVFEDGEKKGEEDKKYSTAKSL